MMMEEVDTWSETSDSEDDLEETPAFIRRNNFENDTDIHGQVSKQKESRLDALLAEHKRENEKQNKLRILRDQLLTEIASSSEERIREDDQDLASEHADHIEKLKVKPIKLRTVHPGLAVFNPDNYGCLFTDSVGPHSYFIMDDSIIDTILSDFSHGDLNESRELISDIMMFPNIFITKIVASPNFNLVMQWLLDLLSIHRNPTMASRIEATMTNILNHLQLKRQTGVCWKPSTLGLLRLLVNLGANPQELTDFQSIFTQEEIRNHLYKGKDENVRQMHKGELNSERFLAVLTLLTHSLQERSVIAKEDLNFMFYMLAKASLDTSLDRNLGSNFHQCFAAIIDHYSDRDWPGVVPELCWQLSHITDHHHNQVYLTGLLHAGQRGSYLQMRVSFTFLYNQLIPEANKIEDSKLHDLQLMDVVELGMLALDGQPSTLAVKLHDLINKDCYMVFSILKLLKMFIGDISSRAALHKKQLGYLLSQVTLVRKTIKDRVSDFDLLKVKDVMNDMTVKWSLALQDQRMTEGSMFPWATATTHQWVKPEILLNSKEQNLTDKGKDNLSSNKQSETP